VVTRHADTDPGTGVLNAAGRERTRALADLVAPMGVTAIYSPDIERNLATVEPLARLSGVEVTRKSAVSVFSAGAIAEEILERHAGGVVVPAMCRETCRWSTDGWAGTAWGRSTTGIYIY
jgi:broad specificity phosphatase PhoE